MSRASLVRGLVVPLLVLGACSRDVRPAEPVVPPTRAGLFITVGLRGSLTPCGCSQVMRGGLDKTAALLEAMRASGDPVLFLNAGDTFFGAASFPDEAVPQQERKARALAEALTSMRVTGSVPGPLDLARGESFRQVLGVPDLSTPTVTNAGGVPVGTAVASDPASAKLRAAELRARGARFVVIFLAAPWDVGMQLVLLENNGVDLAVVTQPKNGVVEENRIVGVKTKLVQLQDRGRSVLRVDLGAREGKPFEWLKGSAERDREVAAAEERIETLRAQVNAPGIAEPLKALKEAKLTEMIARREALASAPLPEPADKSSAVLRAVPVESSLAGAAPVTALITAYDRDVGQMNLEWAQQHGQDCAPPTPQNGGWLGNDVCKACHLPAFELWSGTKHARAYEDLKAKGKEHHLDCVTCHVNGWKQPGGVCRIDKVENHTFVGCEACHGPPWDHLAKPVKGNLRKPEAAHCQTCHDKENSPHFVFDAYVERLKGPGHGQPMTDGGVASVGVVVPAAADAGVAAPEPRPVEPSPRPTKSKQVTPKRPRK